MVCGSGARRRKIGATSEEADGKRTRRRLHGGCAEKSQEYTLTGGFSWHEHSSPS